MLIYEDKLDYPKNPSTDFKKYFCLGFLWIEGKTSVRIKFSIFENCNYLFIIHINLSKDRGRRIIHVNKATRGTGSNVVKGQTPLSIGSDTWKKKSKSIFFYYFLGMGLSYQNCSDLSTLFLTYPDFWKTHGPFSNPVGFQLLYDWEGSVPEE